jgi:salicylate hydroxylase
MKVLVVGGGIGGLTAALCLAMRGWAVEVFEQAEIFSETGAGIQLSPNCTHVLHHLGLEPVLRSIGFLPEGTEFRHWRHGEIIAESLLGDVAVKRYGSPYYHVHRGDLLAALVEAASEHPKIALCPGSEVESVSQSGHEATLVANDCRHSADFIVGADGIHSIVRASLWGSDQASFTGNVAWRALVPAAQLPAGLIRPVSTAWWGPGAHFVHYYVRQGELVNCVCVVEADDWWTESWTEPGELAELKCAYAGWHPDLQLLIDNMDPASLFKWALHDRAPLSQWGRERITLLGDACHPTLPFMAQGAAMAIEDAAVLAGCMAGDQNIEQNLGRYEALRKPRTAAIQRGSRRNARLFHQRGIRAWLRNRAVRAAGDRVMDRLYAYNPLET